MSQDANEAYVHELSQCGTLADLRGLMARYSELAVDAGRVVAAMTDADMAEFKRGLRSERKGRFAGEAWARRFSAVLMPMPMLRVAAIANEYCAPFNVTLRRLKEFRPDLLQVDDVAQDATR